MNGGLAIFVKTPGLSPIKTRLAATRGAAFAEHWHRLAAAAVASVVQRFVERSGWQAYWAVAEADGLCSWSGFPGLLQPQGGLGARMAGIHAELLGRHGRAVLIGADSPQLTCGHLLAADRALGGDADHVLGAAEDGGFWLLGSRLPIDAAIWASVRYSQPDTGSRMQQALAEQARCRQLDRLRDVDSDHDLGPLHADLLALAAPTAAQQALTAWLGAALPGAAR
jgi:glycosyltransferase A (GT-A) superfamily protein (DUF2064 family)